MGSLQDFCDRRQLHDCHPLQIATAATFSAAWLEALRMGFALLERPDGSLASPFAGDAALAVPVLLALLPAAAPAALAGGPTFILPPTSIESSCTSKQSRLPGMQLFHSQRVTIKADSAGLQEDVCCAGGLVSAVAKPGALLLGAAAGLLAWGGAANLVWLPWNGSLGLFWTAAWAAGGGAAAVMLHGQLIGGDDHGKEKADSNDGGCPVLQLISVPESCLLHSRMEALPILVSGWAVVGLTCINR